MQRRMVSFLYRCPASGLQVQGWVAETASDNPESNEYVALGCPVCTRTHLVNPMNGRVLGDDRKAGTK
jgi:hypothetical protein